MNVYQGYIKIWFRLLPVLQVAEASIEHVQLDTNVILDIPIALASDQDHQQMIFSHAEKGHFRIFYCTACRVVK